MAAANQLHGLKEGAPCSICLEYFTDPVSVECGHVFCLSCITRCWEGLHTGFDCLQCKDIFLNKTLLPNKQLASGAEKLGPLQSPTTTPQGANLCREHEEKLKLFCENDQEPICVVCRESRDHKAHSVLPIQEAAQEYKDKLHKYLATLQKSLEDIDELQCKENIKVTELEEAVKNKELKILSTFEEKKMCLEQKKQQQLHSMKTKHDGSLKTALGNISDLEKQKPALRALIINIEEKCQQQDVEFLKDVKSILHRFDHMNFQRLKPDSAGTRLSIQNLRPKLTYLLDKVKQVRADFRSTGSENSNINASLDNISSSAIESSHSISLARHLWKNPVHIVLGVLAILLAAICGSVHFYNDQNTRGWEWASGFAAQLTLDPDTAHRRLILSEDGRSVRLGDRAQILPDTPQRFNPVVAVLGRERLSSGRHYWEVEVGDKTGWTLGVCDETASRKGLITLTPEKGYWSVELMRGEYRANTATWTRLTPHEPLRIVGLFLDYEAGIFSAYNVQDKSLLFTFSRVSFPPVLRPFFYPGTTDRGNNYEALRILPLTGRKKTVTSAR